MSYLSQFAQWRRFILDKEGVLLDKVGVRVLHKVIVLLDEVHNHVC